MWKGTLCEAEGVKRHLFKLVIFFLLGAVVSCLEVVAVEVGINWKYAMNSGRVVWYGRSSKQIPYWSYLSREMFSFTSVTAFRVSSDPGRRPNIPVDTQGLPYWFDEQGETDRNPAATYQGAYGWPMRILWSGGYWYDEHLPFSEMSMVFWRGQETPRQVIRPLWRGLAVNTAFYAMMVWMLWSSPFVVRRIIRRKRGLCFKCGYDLRGEFEQGCPECGWGREIEA